MILVKIGGSLLTNKSGRGPPRYRAATAQRLLQELHDVVRRSREKVILVHGAGSFGHPLALRHRVGHRRIMPGEFPAVVGGLRAAVDALQRRFVATARRVGLDAVAAPAGLLAFDTPRGLHFDDALLQALLERGRVPVTGGDVILHERLGARILSGDELMYRLARTFRPRRVVWATNVPGVELAGHLVLELPPRGLAAALHRVAPGPDATGGMRGKLEWCQRLSEFGVPSLLIDGRSPDRFRRALQGETALGTLVRVA